MDEIRVLKKGLHFCPNNNANKFEVFKDLQLFVRKLLLKSLYQRQHPSTDKTPQENKALNQLISLVEESDTTNLIDCIDLSQILKPVEIQSQPTAVIANK